MKLKVGITGGIGSGKSYVAKVFKALGVPFYDADKHAKELMNTNAEIKCKLVDIFGTQVYQEDGLLDRAFLSSIVFDNEERLKLLNSVVHPVVIAEALKWSEAQTFDYSLKEAALLFESGSYKTLDFTVLVTAPQELKIQRVMARDGVTREQVISRISAQMADEEKMRLADFTIVNDGVRALLPQVLWLHERLLKESRSCSK
ncbi:dephospho-CoA kinase [Sphingobacterium shayense]|uniref:dephospho-CoA kinase n=1 Tax=Sphingobacterium shayense TaxID=626343 RepID=UPI0015553EB1|nr:dephospho-CoA kinase [Sphingobacterium shayense]NQD70577.1 dephospho-CoA kinase [Sphingobacterium shayense]